MSKKGKRKKGNTSNSMVPPRPRPSAPNLPAVASPGSGALPLSASASASGASTAPSRSPSHGDLVAGATSESAAVAEALAPVSAPSEVPPRDDDQEESGPRIVAFAPTKPSKEDEKVALAPAAIAAAAPAAPKEATAKARKAPKSEKTAKSAKAESAPAHAHGVELEHQSFFEAGEKADKEHRAVARRGVLPVEHEHEEDPARKHKMSPAVRERRARFTKYVKWAVGASAVVCLAALVRVTVARGQHPDGLAAGSQAAEIVQAPLPTPPAPEPVAAPIALAVVPPPPTPPPAAAATDTPAPAPAAPTVEPATAPAPSAATAATTPSDVTPDPAAAKEEKTAARKALERGDLKGATEAGERSVALDPTDGDAWLVLGAAYQERGKGADARRAFTACIKQGKRGAVGECAAMLR